MPPNFFDDLYFFIFLETPQIFRVLKIFFTYPPNFFDDLFLDTPPDFFAPPPKFSRLTNPIFIL